MRTRRLSFFGGLVAVASAACTPDLLPLDNPISAGDDSGSGGPLPTSAGLSASGGMDGTTPGSSSGDSGSNTTGTIEQDADGWLVFLADVHEGPEIYAIRDNGEELVRLSQPLAPSSVVATVKEAVMNHDGTKVAWSARELAFGTSDRGLIWVMNIDGSDPSVVANSGDGVYRLGWGSDHRTLYYVNNIGPCREGLFVVDVETFQTGHAWNRGEAAAFTPLPCPQNDNLVLYRDSLCKPGVAAENRLMLWDRSQPEPEPTIIVDPSADFGFNTFTWAEDCTAIFFKNEPSNIIHRLNFGSPERPVAFDPGTSLVQRGVVGNSGERLYVPRCIVDDCDIWVVDLSGAKADPYPLGAPLWWGSETLSWARIDSDFDNNDNGVADGLEP